MQTNLETLGQLERRLTMAVPAKDIDREVSERLKKLSQTERMHGFRPGKVPMKIVQQQYGPQVRSEVIGEAVRKAFDEAIREQNLRVAGYPHIEPGDAEGDAEQLSFSATFEVYPEFKVGDLGAIRIERPALAVGEAEVDKTIEILRKQRVKFDEIGRGAQPGDRVTIDFAGTIDGAEFPGGNGIDVALVLGEGHMLPEFENHLKDLAAGQSGAFTIAFPADYAAKDVAGKSASFTVSMKKVEEPKLPAVDAEFAKVLGVPDGDLAKMREEVKANVEREVKKRVHNDLKQKSMQALVDATPLDLPRSLIDIELQNMARAARAELEGRGIKTDKLPFNPEMFEAQAKRRVALGLIVGELVKSNGIAATAEHVRELVEEHAQSYDKPGEVVKWLYSEPQRLSEFQGLALESNVVKWVLDHAKVEDKVVSFDE
ncbi:MAG: trigger factor, partial [Betaproteobacteria bacterium]|nr:trigger factor [Betaproteobacteria bacterium]